MSETVFTLAFERPMPPGVLTISVPGKTTEWQSARVRVYAGGSLLADRLFPSLPVRFDVDDPLTIATDVTVQVTVIDPTTDEPPAVMVNYPSMPSGVGALIRGPLPSV